MERFRFPLFGMDAILPSELDDSFPAPSARDMTDTQKREALLED